MNESDADNDNNLAMFITKFKEFIKNNSNSNDNDDLRFEITHDEYQLLKSDEYVL